MTSEYHIITVKTKSMFRVLWRFHVFDAKIHNTLSNRSALYHFMPVHDMFRYYGDSNNPGFQTVNIVIRLLDQSRIRV